MELYVIVPLLSLVGGSVGAYLGAYLKRKGENLATHEDLTKLVEQVSAVTRATKEIETKISDEVWNRQRQWEMRRDALFALVKAESAATSALVRLDSDMDAAKGHPPDSPIVTWVTGQAIGNWKTAAAAFDSALVLVSLVCGSDVEKRLNYRLSFMRRAAKRISKGEKISAEHSIKLAEQRITLYDAIRKELSVGSS
jgi:hypothetical protein